MNYNNSNFQQNLAKKLQLAGVAGAGGAGFPSYAKWTETEDIQYLLVNHHESEPNFYSDKWLGKECAEEFSLLFDRLLEDIFDVVVIGTKNKYHGRWIDNLINQTNATVYTEEALPCTVEEETEIVVACTADYYGYSEEEALLMATTGTQVGPRIPTEIGWIVHNTETMYNIYRSIFTDEPVTHKLVHIDGNTPHHRLLYAPIGTLASDLLREAGCEDPVNLPEDDQLVQGGPGWCQGITEDPDLFGIRKRTNGILRLQSSTVEKNTDDQGRTDVRDTRGWDRNHDKEPTKVAPNQVHIPLITNSAYDGVVAASEPAVSVGESVETGDLIAHPVSGEISIAQHASIDGRVTSITDKYIRIEN